MAVTRKKDKKPAATQPAKKEAGVKKNRKRNNKETADKKKEEEKKEEKETTTEPQQEAASEEGKSGKESFDTLVEDNEAKPEEDDSRKVVVTIEAGKDSSIFKTRAQKIAKDLGDKAKIVINRTKGGNFVVKVGDNTLIELTGLEKPFTSLKELNMKDQLQKLLKAVEEAQA